MAKRLNDLEIGVIVGGAVTLIILLISIFTINVKNKHKKVTIEQTIQQKQDSIVLLDNKLDSLEKQLIIDSYEAKLLNDSDAVKLFYELLKH